MTDGSSPPPGSGGVPPSGAATGGPSAQDLVDRVFSGDHPRLTLLAAQGMLPIAAEDLVPVQIALAAGDDPDVSQLAAASLAELDPARVVGLIRHGASIEVVSWFGRRSDDPGVLETILRRRDVPRSLLPHLAARVSPDLQEVLLIRQDAILENPEILEALEGNPRISSFSRRRIGELRTHLLRRQAEPEVVEREQRDEPSDDEVLEAIEAARTAAPGPTTVERDQQTGLTDAQIRLLPVPVRRKLARGASKSLRGILIRDPNPQVAVAALTEGSLSDGEVEQIAANRSVVGEVLEEIARRRDWVTKLKVASALVHNPRTPAGVAVRLLPRMAHRELAALARNHNVSSAVRTQADRLYRMRRR
jgi:hypothetical protein